MVSFVTQDGYMRHNLVYCRLEHCLRIRGVGAGTFWGPGEAREGASVMGGTPASLDMKEAERASPSTFAVMSQCIKKQRHYQQKVRVVKAMVFPVVSMDVRLGA